MGFQFKYVNQTQLKHTTAALETVTPVEKVAFRREKTVFVKMEEHAVLLAHLYAQQLVQQFVAIETFVLVLFQVLVSHELNTLKYVLSTHQVSQLLLLRAQVQKL
jgi:hypothetical protein